MAQCWEYQTFRPGVGTSPALLTGGWTAHSDSGISPPARGLWPDEGEGQESSREARETDRKSEGKGEAEEEDRGTTGHVQWIYETHTHTHIATHLNIYCLHKYEMSFAVGHHRKVTCNYYWEKSHTNHMQYCRSKPQCLKAWGWWVAMFYLFASNPLKRLKPTMV